MKFPHPLLLILVQKTDRLEADLLSSDCFDDPITIERDLLKLERHIQVKYFVSHNFKNEYTSKFIMVNYNSRKSYQEAHMYAAQICSIEDFGYMVGIIQRPTTVWQVIVKGEDFSVVIDEINHQERSVNLGQCIKVLYNILSNQP